MGRTEQADGVVAPHVQDGVKAGTPRGQLGIWAVLCAWHVMWVLARSHGAGGSWHYFATGAAVLFGDDRGQGLHLYATHPELQIGPLSFVVALPLDALGPPWGRTAAVFLMSCTGPLLLAAIWRLVPSPHRRPARLLAAGLVFLPIWAELATHAGHLDDVLALSLAIGALHARVRDRPLLAGLLVGAATDAKPWALAFAAMLLFRPARSAIAAFAVCFAVVAAGWLPFLVYDPHTMHAAHFTIANAAGSGLRVLGYHGPRTPSWDRPAQLALGVLMGAAAVLRRRWEAVILLATAARILLDPEVYGYYTAGVLLGTVVFDLLATHRRLPLVTIAAALTLYLSRQLSDVHAVPLTNSQLGLLRVAFVVIAVIAVFGAARAASRRQEKTTSL
ncbi:glycosyltransferase family 87 protein [Actinomadura violacea]|uniref:DUF2029 domain-containing protein n=1 Tax=Actinomadura violacea TaxID=2819934 RepID=A0ABS3RNY3_9ACTN|nr:glycosyltransferase 87 family protein [Actinomadura violacea]MBO2458331.1 DUF2029 domain-containing protein [Actinomadura violacea]